MHISNLIDELLGAGLVQFGAFAGDEKTFSCRLRMDMLASYPRALKLAAEAITSALSGQTFDRLLCTHDSQPLATLISQMTGIPLVIHSGVLGNPVHQLIGAYDIGHPTALISMTAAYPNGFISRLLNEAAGVGLSCSDWIVLIDTDGSNNAVRQPVITLKDITGWMVSQGEISAETAANIR